MLFKPFTGYGDRRRGKKYDPLSDLSDIQRANNQRISNATWTLGIDNIVIPQLLSSRQPDGTVPSMGDPDFPLQVTMAGIVHIAQKKGMEVTLNDDSLTIVSHPLEVAPALEEPREHKKRGGKIVPQRLPVPEVSPTEALSMYLTYRRGKEGQAEGFSLESIPEQEGDAQRLIFPAARHAMFQQAIDNLPSKTAGAFRS